MKLQSDFVLASLLILFFVLLGKKCQTFYYSITTYYLIKFYWWLFTGKSTNFLIINENSESYDGK